MKAFREGARHDGFRLQERSRFKNRRRKRITGIKRLTHYGVGFNTAVDGAGKFQKLKTGIDNIRVPGFGNQCDVNITPFDLENEKDKSFHRFNQEVHRWDAAQKKAA